MFYCKYCNQNKDDSQIHTEFKKSIKCVDCVRKNIGIDIYKKSICKCGSSYSINSFHTHLKTLRHIKFIAENPLEK